MGNEQSGPDGTNDAGAVPSAPSTPRPILRNPDGNAMQLGGGEEKNRRNVVFRDQTEDALRLNRSIVKGSSVTATPGGQQGAAGGLTRLSQQVNNINGSGPQRRQADAPVEGGPARRAIRTQKPPAPAPPPEHQSEGASVGQELHEDGRVSRMRQYVFSLADKREKRSRGGLDGGGRLYDPSVQELATVVEEKEERSDAAKKGSNLSKVDSTEALREEVKQELLKELLSSPSASSTRASATAVPHAVGGPSGKMNEVEKRRLIAEIRQQLLGGGPSDYADGDMPEPDYPDDAPEWTSQQRQPVYNVFGAGDQQQVRLPRATSEMEIRGAPNGHYRGPPQQLQLQRRYKGPAPAPPTARYRRIGGPPVVREPYQGQWEEPIFAYDGPQSPEQQQQLQEQMEKAYDDRYRQKSRNKRFGDSWKRMTASLSKAFGLGSGGGGGGGAAGGLGRRSSVRESTFERPSGTHQQQSLSGSRAGSVYSLASAEMPPLVDERPQEQNRQAGSSQAHQRKVKYESTTDEIWRDVAKASHEQMLHTRNPVYDAQEPPEAMNSNSSASSKAKVNSAANHHRGNGQISHPPAVSTNASAADHRSPIARVTVTAPKVNEYREQTYL